MDPEQRRKIEDGLLRKAEGLVRQMRAVAETGEVSRVEDLAKQMAELLKTKEFPNQRAAEFRDLAKQQQRNVCRLSVDSLLSQAERLAHRGDEKGRNDLLNKAKATFALAIRYGADEEFRHGVERRAQALLLTTRDGVDDRTKLAAKRRLEIRSTGPKPPDGVEHRRALRYMDPVLIAVIDGERYTTVNWSTRGMLLEPLRPDAGLHEGSRVRIDLSCEEVKAGGRQPAHVVRLDPDRNAFAVEFPEISTVVLEMMHAMREESIAPEVEG